MTMPSDTSRTEDTELLMHAHLDGELNAADTLALKERIDADPALASELETYKVLQQTLRARFPREELSPKLRAHLDAAIENEKQSARPTWMALAASIAAAILVSSVTTWLMLRSDQSATDPHARVAQQVAFPRDFGVRYASVASDASDSVRDLYASPAALDAVRAGKPLPYGTVLVRNLYDIARDAAGAPVKDANGMPVKAKLQFTTVMEKQPGWFEFPAGEWKYRTFGPDGTPTADSGARCFACHNKVRDQDFVFSLDRMKLARN
jgi:hypothetical protein